MKQNPMRRLKNRSKRGLERLLKTSMKMKKTLLRSPMRRNIFQCQRIGSYDSSATLQFQKTRRRMKIKKWLLLSLMRRKILLRQTGSYDLEPYQSQASATLQIQTTRRRNLLRLNRRSTLYLTPSSLLPSRTSLKLWNEHLRLSDRMSERGRGNMIS